MNLELITKALTKRFRFEGNGGSYNLEGLFQLKPEQLDAVYTAIQATLPTTTGLLKTSAFQSEIEEKLEIVKYIFDLKTDEAQKHTAALEKKRQNERIRELIEKKKENALETLSIEELEKLLQ